jgi:hypothetical protein
MVLCLDDGPGRAVVIFDAGTALGAFLRVDDIAVFTFGDSTHRTLKEAAAALDAVFGNFIGHDGLLKGWSWEKQQY